MKYRIFGLAMAGVLLSGAVLWACSIPVFRYALERWELTPYEVVVFHRGPLPAADKALVRQLEGPKPRANLSVTLVNLEDKVEAEYRKLWDAQKERPTLPWLVVRLAQTDEQIPPAWAGGLKEVPALLDSPARRQLVKALSKGESAVFLLLSSDDAKADQEAKGLLARELAKLAKTLELPEQSPEGPQLRTKLPLRVSFQVLPLSRGDVAEQPFVHMLLGSEEDLHKAKGPIVFPVFGRGRLLCALHGDDLTAKQLYNVGRFLCGACSCQVKELNPGIDLLIAADWNQLLFDGNPPPELPRVGRPKNKTRG